MLGKEIHMNDPKIIRLCVAVVFISKGVKLGAVARAQKIPKVICERFGWKMKSFETWLVHMKSLSI